MKKKETDFRVVFAQLPDDALLDLEEFAKVARMPSVPAVRKALCRHRECMPAVVRLRDGPKGPMRFRVGDVRAWIRWRAAGGQLGTPGEAEQQAEAAAGTERQKHGRPRMSPDVPGLASASNLK